MLTTGIIIENRIKEVKKLMEYINNKGQPKDEQSEQFYLWDWYEGNTKYRKLTNKLLKNYN